MSCWPSTFKLILLCVLQTESFGLDTRQNVTSEKFIFTDNNNTNSCPLNTVCVRKCCPKNHLIKGRSCSYSNDSYFYPEIFDGRQESTSFVRFNVISANYCAQDEKRFISMPEHSLYLQENGYLWRFHKKTDRMLARVEWNKYCLESLVVKNTSRFIALECIKKEQTLPKPLVDFRRLSMIISMPFLLATFLVYAILPDRNVHQRALMFYVLTLCISYILLVTINLSSQLAPPWCEIIAYATLFFFMVSFFWMNVICFDIWYTFSGGRGFVGSKRSSERRRLLYYSAYAWGVPLLHVLIVFMMQNVLPPSSVHNPGIGTTKCFLTDGFPNLWYFYGEAAILVIANIVFFLCTALKIRQVKKETSMLKQNDSKRHAYEKDKQKFNLYLKLLFAMGVNWSMEVISWLVNWQTNNRHTEVWYVTDFFNAVYGVFIFFIFVFKKKIWKLLQKRYYNFIGKPHLAHTMTSTNTRTSHYSSTNYSTADTTLTDRTNANGPRSEEMGLRRVT